MSKLEQLIKKHCPDGVEYKRFDEACSLHARIGWQRLTKTEHQKTGDYLLITGTDFTSDHKVNYETCVYVSKERYDQDKKLQLVDGDILVTKDGTLGKIAQVKGLSKPATLNGGVFVVRPLDDSLNSRYILHYLLSNHFMSVVHSRKTGSTISHLTQGLFSQLLIPIPPLSVQEEIVRILDSYTELEAEYEGKLAEELEMRKKQYEYYRDELLSLKDFDGEVDTYSLSEVTTRKITDGMHNLPSNITSEGYAPILSAVNIYDGKLHFDTGKYVNEDTFIQENKRTDVSVGDVLLTIVATIGRVAVIKEPVNVLLQRSVSVIRPNQDVIISDYLKFYLETNLIQNYMQKHAHGAAQKGFYVNQLNELKISIPADLNVQKRIVVILDKLNTKTQDMSENLSAEIQMRHQQYEYYRDMLLTFKRLEAV